MPRSLYRLEDGHNVSAKARANIVSNDQWAVLNEPRSLLVLHGGSLDTDPLIPQPLLPKLGEGEQAVI